MIVLKSRVLLGGSPAPPIMNFNFVPYFMQGETDIKAEVVDHSSLLASPPITPSPPSSLSSLQSTSSRRRGSSSSLAGSRFHRPRPYPSINSDANSRKPKSLDEMSSSSTYATWNTNSSRSGQHRTHSSAARRISDEEYAISMPNQFMNGQYLANLPEGAITSASSTLSGAMGHTNMTSQSRQSHSPASSNSGHMYTGNVPANMNWNQVPSDMSLYPGVAGLGFTSDSSPLGNSLDLGMGNLTTRNESPESLSPHSPHYPSGFDYPSQAIASQSGGIGYQNTLGYGPQGSEQRVSPDEELQRLRRRVRELELQCSHLKSNMATVRGNNASHGSRMPNPARTTAFQQAWQARTEARKRMFCSLNRAGNALCAWHDSRRERRAYPPRNAPSGYLNCGCTHDEALFEESLARHGVGSYLPGEMVRMDPALRNPLLKLLEKRFGYKDGDFEHDPFTETWYENESPSHWEAKAQSGQVARRRAEPERP